MFPLSYVIVILIALKTNLRARCVLELPSRQAVVDTFGMAEKIRGVGGKSLSALCYHYGHLNRPYHRAGPDAESVALILPDIVHDRANSIEVVTDMEILFVDMNPAPYAMTPTAPHFDPYETEAWGRLKSRSKRSRVDSTEWLLPIPLRKE
jgi:hypothetical protein